VGISSRGADRRGNAQGGRKKWDAKYRGDPGQSDSFRRRFKLFVSKERYRELGLEATGKEEEPLFGEQNHGY